MGSNHGTGKLDILNNPKIELFIGVVCITGFEIMVSIDIQVKYSSIIHIIYQNEEVFSNVLKNISVSIIQKDSSSLSFMQTMNLNR